MPDVSIDRMPREQRPIRRRLIIRGTLVLQTPTHFGNGDSEAPTDMALLRDSVSNAALLTGSSIAGALRSYLRARERGEFAEEPRTYRAYAETLFGGIKGEDEGSQSPLVVADALAERPLVDLRDGVKLELATRTPDSGAKYDLELLAAGTGFGLEFALAIEQHTAPAEEQRLIQALLAALRALGAGEIGLGMKKRRGFGRCTVCDWQVWDFNLREPQQLHAWLAFGRGFKNHPDPAPGTLDTLAATLSPGTAAVPDARRRARLTATFALCGPLLIRAGQDEATDGPDVRHLHARQPDGVVRPILSGTSLAGVIRHQAERIVNTLAPGAGEERINTLFGYTARGRGDPGLASRVIVHEHVVQHVVSNLVQSRVSIDRFTGGAYAGALFSEQPAFPTAESRATVEVELLAPADDADDQMFHAELGLLLLVLKDLWRGDLAVGGESGIGRGRLAGRTLTVTIGQAPAAELAMDPDGAIRIAPEGRAFCNACVAALHRLARGEVSR